MGKIREGSTEKRKLIFGLNLGKVIEKIVNRFWNNQKEAMIACPKPGKTYEDLEYCPLSVCFLGLSNM